jgi:lipopolysaccharide export system permease protein
MLLAFVMLFSIFNILGQIGDVGKGEFSTASMLFYTVLLIPNYMYLLMPLAILIGVMLAMLSLVNYSEYAIIRTSGVSLRTIMIILLSYGFTFSLITLTLGEFIAPIANNYAQIYKKTKMRETVSTQLHTGIWSKDGDHGFVNIKQIMPDSTIIGVNVLHYDDSLKLQEFLSADKGHYDTTKNAWILDNVIRYDYTKLNIESSLLTNYVWTTTIEPKYFNVLIIPPEDMSALGLLKYMEHLETNNQSTRRYKIAFWGKLVYPFACVSMALIALAFTPNNRRNINLGSKLFAGILIGVAFFFTTRLVGFLAFLFHWNAILSAILPTVGLFSVGWYFVLRKE